MKKGDFIWGAVLGVVVLLLVYPLTHNWILDTTKNHPYLMGFIKFAILATMGELLSIRIVSGRWIKPIGPVFRAIVWGLMGVSLVVVFPIFSTGVGVLQKAGLMPIASGDTANYILNALLVSVIMNIAWAPTLMLIHKVCDTYIDLAGGSLAQLFTIRVIDVANAIDWKSFLGFVVFKTIPLFWIPAHTITFLFPPELRVLVAAFLSLALGLVLGFAKTRSAVTGPATIA